MLGLWSDTEQTFTISGTPIWLTAPAPFKVPARDENSAGVTTVEFRWNAIDPEDNGQQPKRNYEYKKRIFLRIKS